MQWYINYTFVTWVVGVLFSFVAILWYGIFPLIKKGEVENIYWKGYVDGWDKYDVTFTGVLESKDVISPLSLVRPVTGAPPPEFPCIVEHDIEALCCSVTITDRDAMNPRIWDAAHDYAKFIGGFVKIDG